MSFLHYKKISLFILILLSGIILAGFCPTAGAAERAFRQREFMDSRHGHERSYPARGQFVNTLPPGHRVVVFGKTRYFFFDGVWYLPRGGRFLIVAPPIGLVVPFLPPYYTTVMIGGAPYYYANEVYYTAAPGGYVVVAPPSGEAATVSPPSPGPALPGTASSGTMPGEKLFIYPRQGQDEKKQATDQYECHRWAFSQTGYDPTKPSEGMPEAQKLQKYSDYKRAMGACLDARGYSVK